MKNFFEHQDVARRNTTRLVLLFTLAVLLTVVAVYFIVLFGFNWAEMKSTAPGQPTRWTLWSPSAFLMSLVGVSALVGGGTLFKIRELARGGGSMVCETMGGRFIDYRTTDAAERRLINVVQEMAIASGVSVPLIYVLDHEEGINAFAAGFSSNEAAIAVSAGCLKYLDRDELQGVIAHEFSHILNGDMRINIRMIGVLHGILMIAVTGTMLIRAAGLGGHRSRRRSKNDGGALWLVAVGAALWAVGSIGQLFGRMIKSAISRQREFLADASAVQFTRNPQGIAGALKKIGGFPEGSHIGSSRAEEISHMFFSNALDGSWMDFAFATHPPLMDRIRRIDPSFHGAFPRGDMAEQVARKVADEVDAQAASGLSGGGYGGGGYGGGGYGGGGAGGFDGSIEIDPETVIAEIGQADQAHMEHAHNLLESIPVVLREAATDVYAASGVVFAMLVAADDSADERQWAYLQKALTPAMVAEMKKYSELIGELDPRTRMPLVEILVPALRQMSDRQLASFRKIVRALMEADEQITVFEFCLEKLLLHRLEAGNGEDKRRAPRYMSLTPLVGDLGVVLSFLAHAGNDTPKGIQQAFHLGKNAVPNMNHQAQLAAYQPSRPDADFRPDDRDYKVLGDALDRLSKAASAIKKIVVESAAYCVLSDNRVSVEEAELLRCVCELIDVPVPPFIGGTPKADAPQPQAAEQASQAAQPATA